MGTKISRISKNFSEKSVLGKWSLKLGTLKHSSENLYLFLSEGIECQYDADAINVFKNAIRLIP